MLVLNTIFRTCQNFQNIRIVFLKQFYKSPDFIIGDIIRFIGNLRNIIQSKEIFLRQIIYPADIRIRIFRCNPKALLPEMTSKRRRFLFFRSWMVIYKINIYVFLRSNF